MNKKIISAAVFFQIALLVASFFSSFAFVKTAHASSGSISASPSQFDGSQGGPFTTYVSWNTNDLATDEVVAVYVTSSETPNQVLFAADAAGSSRDASWIYPHSNPTQQNIYTFNLYSRNRFDDANNQSLLHFLGSTTVVVSPRGTGGGGGGAAATGSISANPTTCTAATGQNSCQTTITASAQNSPQARIYVSSGNGENYFQDAASCSGGCAATVSTVSPSTFTLYDYSGGVRASALANVTVYAQAGAAATPTLTIAPQGSVVSSGALINFAATYDPDGPDGPQFSQNVGESASWSVSGNGLTCTQSAARSIYSCINSTASNQIASVSATYAGLTAFSSFTVLGVATGGGGTPPAPTASLTGNGTRGTITVDVGQTVHYSWSSTNADEGSSSFVSDDTNCYGSSGNWVVNTTNGSQDAVPVACQAGHTYTVTFRVRQSSTGVTASDTLVIIVRQQAAAGTPTLAISPSSASIASGQTTQFQANYDPDGASTAQSPQNVTSAAAWSVVSSGSATCTRPSAGAFTCTNPTSIAQTVSISVSYSGLTQNGTIVVAPQGTGTPTLSVETGTAGNINQNSANVTGYISTNTSGVTYYFEYGTSASLGNATPVQNLSTSGSNQAVYAGLSGLQPNTRYYYRLSAQSAGGTPLSGATLSFTTFPSGGGGGGTAVPTFTILPSSAAVSSGQSYQFAAMYDSDGSGPLAAQNVNASASWSQNAPSGVSCSVSSGVATCTSSQSSSQTATISASYLGLVASAALSILPTGTQVPQAQTLSASAITQTSAVLNGQINPSGTTVSYRFEYGTTVSLGNSTGYQSLSGGSSYQSVSASVAGLAANTAYYFRVVAQTAAGGTIQGDILSFTTTTTGGGGGGSIIVQTLSAAGVSQNSATLNGAISGNGVTGIVNYRFAYGADASLSAPSYTSYQSLTLGNFSQNVFMGVYSLAANTTYYYRLEAQPASGSLVSGSVASFTTGSTYVPPTYIPPTTYYYGGGYNYNYTGGYNGSAPVVQTLSATVNQGSYATLNGQVNGNGSSVTYWFEYANNPGLTFSTATAFQYLGYTSNFQSVFQSVYGLNSGTTYYYRIVGQNQYGTTYGNIYSFAAGSSGVNAPTVQTMAASSIFSNTATLNGQVNAAPDTQVWFEYGVNANSLSYTTNATTPPGYGNYYGSAYVNGNFNQTIGNLQTGTTYYFRAVARNTQGTAYGQTLSFATDGNSISSQNPTAITRQPSLLYQNSALLNGVANPRGGLATAWFDYGTSPSLGLHTVQQPVGSGVNDVSYSYALSGLLPNTLYYYQAIVQGPSGNQAKGEIVSFQTASTGGTLSYYAPRRVNVAVASSPNIQVTGQYSCLTLVPALNASKVSPGQEFTFTITYRNGCSSLFRTASLRIVFPAEVDFISSSNPYFTRQGNVFDFNIGDLPTNAAATINMRAVAHKELASDDALIFTAMMNFVDNAAFQSVVAYLTVYVVDSSAALTGLAALFAAGGFLSSPWLSILLVILILILLYQIASRRRNGSGGEVV